MENTGKMLFEDDSSQWYISLGTRWVGPLTASEVYQKIVSQEISWAHYVWKNGQPEWRRICDVKAFQAAVPHAPPKAITAEIKQASRPEIRQSSRRVPSPPGLPGAESPDERTWFLYHNDSQFGPFSKREVDAAIRAGKVSGKIYAWQDGMDEWKKLEDIAAFASVASARKPPTPPAAPKSGRQATPVEAMPQQKKESRKAPRRPLVAKIVMAHDDAVHVGVCRDISVGGMQVLTERVPSTVGKRIKLNVSAPGQIEPFVAEGVVVRILEDGRGFSFRFERLPEPARRSIERYLETNSV